jgi:hypothetical protein
LVQLLTIHAHQPFDVRRDSAHRGSRFPQRGGSDIRFFHRLGYECVHHVRALSKLCCSNLVHGRRWRIDRSRFGRLWTGGDRPVCNALRADGIYGGITATSGDGVSVNIASSDRVILRGLTINGLGAANGIHFVADGELRIDNVRVNNFQSRQIWSEAAGSISIHNCAIRGHRVFSSTGILVSTTSGSAQAVIANTDVEDGGECIYIGANTTATVVNSRVNQCNARGFRVVTGGDLTIEGSAATNSSEGLLAGCGGGTARISNSTFTGNFFGVRLCTGIVYTHGNNSSAPMVRTSTRAR